MQKIKRVIVLASLIAGLSPCILAETSNSASQAAYDFNAKNFNTSTKLPLSGHTPGTNTVDFFLVGSNGSSIIPIGPDAATYIAKDRDCDYATCYYKYYANDGFDNSHLEYNFKTDRKDNQEIVTWVDDQLNDEDLPPPPTEGKYEPQKLAFAYLVDLRFLDEFSHLTLCKNIILAQGHYGTRHDWYVYSNYYNQAAVTVESSEYHTIIKCTKDPEQKTVYYRVAPTNMDSLDIECTYTLQEVSPTTKKAPTVTKKYTRNIL